MTPDALQRAAQHCVTHSFACPCREARLQRLEALLVAARSLTQHRATCNMCDAGVGCWRDDNLGEVLAQAVAAVEAE